MEFRHIEFRLEQLNLKPNCPSRHSIWRYSIRWYIPLGDLGTFVIFVVLQRRLDFAKVCSLNFGAFWDGSLINSPTKFSLLQQSQITLLSSRSLPPDIT